MTRLSRLRDRVLRGTSDANIMFTELCNLLRALGFEERVRGDHHIFHRRDVAEIINLQPLPGGDAKPYQVKQVRTIIVKYQLGDLLDA